MIWEKKEHFLDRTQLHRQGVNIKSKRTVKLYTSFRITHRFSMPLHSPSIPAAFLHRPEPSLRRPRRRKQVCRSFRRHTRTLAHTEKSFGGSDSDVSSRASRSPHRIFEIQSEEKKQKKRKKPTKKERQQLLQNTNGLSQFVGLVLYAFFFLLFFHFSEFYGENHASISFNHLY